MKAITCVIFFVKSIFNSSNLRLYEETTPTLSALPVLLQPAEKFKLLSLY